MTDQPTGPAALGPATVLNPAARLLWRSDRCVQLELGRRRIIVDGVGAPVVGELVGHRRAEAAASLATTRRLQDRLVAAGFLWPAATDGDGRRSTRVPRLAGELVALTARHGERAAELLEGRACSAVAVQGSGRVGPVLAAVLGAAGVGAVRLLDPTPVHLSHASPGGVTPDEEGRPLAEAAARAVRRAAPETETGPATFGERPDLVVLAVDEPVDPERREALHASGCAHLLVSLAPDHAVVGPLVLPGLTSCLGCTDLHRLDRDPAWNALAVQLSTRSRGPAAGDVALTTMLAGLAALEVLTFLDGGQPATVEGSLEITAGEGRVRRRSWPIHPDCPCV